MGLLSETTDLTQVTGTIYLNLPDVEITEAKVVNEEEGKRTVQIKLNNHADAALIGHGRSQARERHAYAHAALHDGHRGAQISDFQ